VGHAEIEVGDASTLAPVGGDAPALRRDVAPAALAPAATPGRWARFLDGDVWHSFRTSPTAVGAALVAIVCLVAAVFANVIAPHDPFNLATLELSDSMLPPAWLHGGIAKYPLGTDEQGRDVLSALMFGARISLFVGGASVLLSLLVGVTLGLLSGYVGGRTDAFIMRICDVMLSFPSILVALLFAGVGHALFPNANDSLAFGVVIVAIALPGWVQYARAVRGSTMVERHKEYVQAARVIGVPAHRIMLRHVLPNVTGPVMVLSTIQIAVAILAEATLSFLGVGVSPTSPSLGTFINEGNKQLFSGAWWLVVFPGATLVLITLSINLFGDWLRDALNPRLR
jgi:peptide/nickel transport system permease protein